MGQDQSRVYVMLFAGLALAATWAMALNVLLAMANPRRRRNVPPFALRMAGPSGTSGRPVRRLVGRGRSLGSDNAGNLLYKCQFGGCLYVATSAPSTWKLSKSKLTKTALAVLHTQCVCHLL